MMDQEEQIQESPWKMTTDKKRWDYLQTDPDNYLVILGGVQSQRKRIWQIGFPNYYLSGARVLSLGEHTSLLSGGYEGNHTKQ